MDNKLFIAYTRVSTKMQGDSGLGLEAQMQRIKSFVENCGGRLVNIYQEIETGTRKKKRIEIHKAIRECEDIGGTLIVAKLDRLARDSEFVNSVINNSKIEVCFCDMPGANRLFIQIAAAFAEYEAGLIAERTKSALTVLKANGVKLGNPNPGWMKQPRKARERSLSDNSKLKGYIGTLRGQQKTYREIAEILNNDGFKTSEGGTWTHSNVYKQIQNVQEPGATI